MNHNFAQVVLVNDQDDELGTMEKLEAHQKGVLHRAFSIFILNHKNELLIQKRADGKYHSGGLWSNACCSHPLAQESVLEGAHRRLKEELGFDCELETLFQFTYKAEVGNGLIEHEYDHVFVGNYSGEVNINLKEVKDYKFISIEKLLKEMTISPKNYTAWFHIALPMFINAKKIYNS